jgi:Acetyltransferase (GNAT) domain
MIRCAGVVVASRLSGLAGSLRSALGMGRALIGLEPIVECRLSGRLPRSDRELRVRVLARERVVSGLDFLFEPSSSVERSVLWRGSLLALRRRVCTDDSSDDLVLRERLPGVPGSRASPGDPVFVPYLLASLPVQPDEESQLRAIPSRSTRVRLEQAGRYPVTRRVTLDPAEVERFYHHGFKPFVERRFGRAALVQPIEEIRRRLGGGGRLLLVEAEGVPVAGALLYVARSASSALYWWKAGIYDAAAGVPNEYRGAALELNVLAHARERGFRTLTMGLAHGLAANGVFVHKRRLGCDFVGFPGAPRFRLALRREARARVLAHMPLLVRGERGFECWIGLDPEAPDSRPIEQRLADAKFPSLAGARIFSAAPLEPRSLQEARSFGRPVELVVD